MMYGRGYNVGMNCAGFGSGYVYGGWGMTIFMAVFTLLAIAAVIYIVKRSRRQQSGNEALQALKMRLAKGEISEEEYLRKKNVID